MNDLEATTFLNTIQKVYLAPSKIHGIGVFALFDLKKGDKIYADEVARIYHIAPGNQSKLFPEIKKMILEQWPRATIEGKFAWPTTRWIAYMNHSLKSNYHGGQDVMLKDVKRGEEITENYCLIEGASELFKDWLVGG